MSYAVLCWSSSASISATSGRLGRRHYGGGGMNAVTSAMCLEEMSRADAGLATAASCSVWAMSPIMPPRENRYLMELFTPRFLQTDRWYVGSAAITDGRSGSDVENLDGTQGRLYRHDGPARRRRVGDQRTQALADELRRAGRRLRRVLHH